MKELNKRITELEKEVAQHQRDLQISIQRQNQLTQLIISKQGGIVELQQLLKCKDKK